MKFLLVSILITLFGNSYSQTAFFAEVSCLAKLNRVQTNFTNYPSGFNSVSEDFTIKINRYSLHNPLKLGFALGYKNKKNEVKFQFNYDGSATSAKINFASYQEYTDQITPNSMTFKTSSFSSTFSLNYSRVLFKRKNSFALTTGVNFFRRTGRKGPELLSELTYTSYLDTITNFIEVTHANRTSYRNYGFGFNIGCEYAFYKKERYLFTLFANFKYCGVNLYTNDYRIVTRTNSVKEYYFQETPLNTSFSIGFFRRFEFFKRPK